MAMTEATKAMIRELAIQDVDSQVFRSQAAVERIFGRGSYSVYRGFGMERIQNNNTGDGYMFRHRVKIS